MFKKERNKDKYVFELKKFTIRHEKSAMKIGVDSIILGAWTRIPSQGRILDVGTGCGILALMMAQRTNLEIDAVECDKLSYEEALENFYNSLWKDRLFIYNCFFQEYALNCNKNYSLIICNPPYFKAGTTPSNPTRKNARHDKLLTLQELIFYSKRLLDKEGFLSIIIPFERYNDLKKFVDENKMFINRILYVKPTPVKSIRRVCLEISISKNNIFEEKNLIIEMKKRKEYSEDYINLTKDFYIIF